MHISIVVAMTHPQRLIGVGGTMPWHLPSDLERFRMITRDKTVVMGMGTHKSIGKRLANRANIVITHHPDQVAAHCVAVPGLPHALAAAPSSNIFVIGGQSVYEQVLPMPETRRIYLTEIDRCEIAGGQDARYFPSLSMTISGEDEKAEWVVNWAETRKFPSQQHPKDDYPTRFVVLDRR